jgi:hypothetical protein
VRAGTDFTIQVGLFGEAALANATVEATARLPARAVTTSLLGVTCTGSLAEAQLCLSATLQAPQESGPERFEVKLPGLDPFNDVLLIL